MMQMWIYSVAASSDPDHVRCMVPWRVDKDLIFFGPCKKRIRERLRRQFLEEGISHAKVTEELFIVGVNGSNQIRTRKVVWAGRLSEVMTFAEADGRLKGDRFHDLRRDRDSPLHVRPLMESGELIGYEHVSELHCTNKDWISDLVSASAQSNIQKDGRKLILREGTPWETFDRDCCLLLKNIFFAQGQGISFDEEALTILRQAQPEKKSEIDNYAIFGLKANRHADGLRGKWLTITGNLASRFIAWLEDRARQVADQQRNETDGRAKKSCT